MLEGSNKVYHSKFPVFTGTSLDEVASQARIVFRYIAKNTRRAPYIRSSYFDKNKVFLNMFWIHLYQKNPRDRTRRLKFYRCAIDLLQNSQCTPTIKQNPNGKSELVYRFYGVSKDGKNFYVQVKEDKNCAKHLMSIVAPDKLQERRAPQCSV